MSASVRVQLEYVPWGRGKATMYTLHIPEKEAKAAGLTRGASTIITAEAPGILSVVTRKTPYDEENRYARAGRLGGIASGKARRKAASATARPTSRRGR